MIIRHLSLSVVPCNHLQRPISTNLRQNTFLHCRYNVHRTVCSSRQTVSTLQNQSQGQRNSQRTFLPGRGRRNGLSHICRTATNHPNS